ncbi:unnamed protein product [Auanema sp. JU1783]|nr:unnamed protein product [Auanema sp. JU1783]
MVFRKYKAVKQWGKMDTRIFKEILNSRNNRKMPSFQIPDAVKASGVQVHDPNTPGFFSSDAVKNDRVAHPAFRATGIEEHPLYHSIRCYLFDGSEPMSDGVSQAACLSKAVVHHGLPQTVLHAQHGSDLNEQNVADAILHAERYDPTLEKLPRRFDPILFWVKHPRVHGTPVIRRNNIILENLTRHLTLAGLHSGRVTDYLRIDRDEPISAFLQASPHFNISPFVMRFQPHLTLQGETAIAPWANKEEVERFNAEAIPDIYPLSPIIDLGSDHIYNEDAVVSRSTSKLSLHTLLWSREQDQKYPWTKEQNAANAILHTFGAAVTEAMRNPRDLQKNPVLVKGVQLVDGKMDLVAFQLNTLDLSAENGVKNIVWMEKGIRLYKNKPFYENLEEVEDLNMETVHKFSALLLNR